MKNTHYIRAAKDFQAKYEREFPLCDYPDKPDCIASIQDGDAVPVSVSVALSLDGGLLAEVMVEDNYPIPDECIHDIAQSKRFLTEL